MPEREELAQNYDERRRKYGWPINSRFGHLVQQFFVPRIRQRQVSIPFAGYELEKFFDLGVEGMEHRAGGSVFDHPDQRRSATGQRWATSARERCPIPAEPDRNRAANSRDTNQFPAPQKISNERRRIVKVH